MVVFVFNQFEVYKTKKIESHSCSFPKTKHPHFHRTTTKRSRSLVPSR